MRTSQYKAWDYRYYDSYRPSTKSEPFLERRSPKFATEFKAVRHHSNQSWRQAKSSIKKSPQGDASTTLEPLRSQSRHYSPAAASVLDLTSPFTGHSPEQLFQMPSKERKDMRMPDTALSRASSHTVDPDKRNESEAQSRGFYGSSRSPNSDAVHLGQYELKRRGAVETSDRSVKRRRDTTEEEEKAEEEEGDKPAGTSDSHKHPRRYHCKNYMCMEYHRYDECDKPKICWGCRSTK